MTSELPSELPDVKRNLRVSELRLAHACERGASSGGAFVLLEHTVERPFTAGHAETRYIA